MRRVIKPLACVAAATKRARALSDFDRCCAIWWFYRLHFGMNRDRVLALAAVTVA